MTGRILTVDISNLIRKNLYIIIFILGLVMGTILINTLSKEYCSKLNITEEYYINLIGDTIINKSDIFFNCIQKYFKEFFIILIFNCFYFGKLYNLLFTMYKGAGIGIVISVFVMKYGAGGVLVYLISIFPHYILYVPALIFVLMAGRNIRSCVVENISQKYKYNADNINMYCIIKVVKRLVVYMLIGFLAAMLISLLEAYINIPLFKSVLQKT